jgi:hypothetical protein
MLAGRPPFHADGAGDLGVLAAHLCSPPPPLSTAGGGNLPAGLESVVARCLAKAPEHRFPDGMTLAAALSAVKPAR